MLALTFLGLALSPLTANANTSKGKPVTLRVAVASNFAHSAKQLAQSFERQHQVNIHWISAATGTLFQQIRYGAPFDAFFSADKLRPQKLAEQGLIIAETLQPYAIGQLGFYAANQPKLTIESISQGQFIPKRVAFAKPETAPYGKAAQYWLKQNKLWQSYQGKAITGINVAQTFQQARTGAVDIGFVAVSQLIAHQLPIKLIPLDNQHLLSQYAGVLTSSKQQALADKLIKFFNAPAQQAKLTKLGYLPITSSKVNKA